MSTPPLAHAAAASMTHRAASGRPPAEREAASPDVVASASASAQERGRWQRDLWLLVLLLVLTAAAWQIAERGWVRPQDPIGYWVGVVGASMMLLLFLYPLRKYAGWMRRMGKVKVWFWFHLVMGVAGPWLILVHSGFHTGSVNAAVALYSMGVVVASGVIGRFLYVRLGGHIEEAEAALQTRWLRAGFAAAVCNQGPEGGKADKGEKADKGDKGQAAIAGQEAGAAPSVFHYAPAVGARLKAFEARELTGEPGRIRALRQVLLLPMQRRIALARCLHELRAPLARRAAEGRWSADELARRRRRAERLIDQLLEAVVRVARHEAFSRVFALWHLAHLPFIYLLVISTVVHVVAVHAY